MVGGLAVGISEEERWQPPLEAYMVDVYGEAATEQQQRDSRETAERSSRVQAERSRRIPLLLHGLLGTAATDTQLLLLAPNKHRTLHYCYY